MKVKLLKKIRKRFDYGWVPYEDGWQYVIHDKKRDEAYSSGVFYRTKVSHLLIPRLISLLYNDCDKYRNLWAARNRQRQIRRSGMQKKKLIASLYETRKDC